MFVFNVLLLVMPNLIVTGFGPFDTLIANPSSDIVSALSCRDDIVLAIPEVNVSISGVDSALAQIAGIQSPFLIVHFGVDMNAIGIKIESQAFNEKNFRIPDQEGNVCINEQIVEGGSSILSTSLNVIELVSLDPCCSLSTDPGRYICNLLYYKSLLSGYRSVFIHVPPFSVMPMEKQLEVINCILDRVE
jgi:pyroglutamyl-peptidase